jgi:hypothetical protein
LKCEEKYPERARRTFPARTHVGSNRSCWITPDVTKMLAGAAKGDYNGALATAVQQYANASDVANVIPTPLEDLATSAQDAARSYEKNRQTVSDAQEKANQGAALLKAIQSNDRDKLIAVGMDVMQRLSPDTRNQLLASVGEVTDLESALILAGNGTSNTETGSRIGARSIRKGGHSRKNLFEA